MTFSIAAKCPRTGMFGLAVATSNMNCAARVLFARAKAGAVLTQARADPRLGAEGVELLSQGLSAGAVIERLTANRAHSEWRQLAAVDAAGRTAQHTGERTTAHRAHAAGAGAIALGNGLADDRVPAAMLKAFQAEPERHVADRLLRALEAGLAAGGEPKMLKSAGLMIVHEHAFPLADLRVEFDPDPLAKLRFLWEIYRAMIPTYLTRALDPANAPSTEYLV
jgi:uncharacterized Ntn-hydrolase superfamily protein